MKLSDLPSYYLKSIVTNNKVNIIKYNNEIKNLLLIDFNEMPNQINNISSELQEELLGLFLLQFQNIHILLILVTLVNI